MPGSLERHLYGLFAFSKQARRRNTELVHDCSLKFLYAFIQSRGGCCISVCCCPRHNTGRHSLSMLVLSSSDTHNFNGCIEWCGCHEISMPCFTGLFLSIFLDYSTTAIEISLFLYFSVRQLTSGLLDSLFKIEELFHRMGISLSEWKVCIKCSFFS